MAASGMVAPVSVKTSMSYDDSKVDDFERKSMGSDEVSEDYKVLCVHDAPNHACEIRACTPAA